jgi:hypothetical protein
MNLESNSLELAGITPLNLDSNLAGGSGIIGLHYVQSNLRGLAEVWRKG